MLVLDRDLFPRNALYDCHDHLLGHKPALFGYGTLYGKARRVWMMDGGLDFEEVLTEMREADPPVHYLLGTPKGRLLPDEKQFLDREWREVRRKSK